MDSSTNWYAWGAKAVGQRAENLGSLIGLAQHAALAARPLDRVRLEDTLQRLIAERRRRSTYFAADLFSDPAWDILLALMLAESRQERLTISKLCERVDVPMTTSLRWIVALIDQRLLLRRDDPTDKRRKFIELTAGAQAAMAAYCAGDTLPMAFAA